MFSISMEDIHSPPDLMTSLSGRLDGHVAVGIERGDVAGVEPAFAVESVVAFAAEIALGHRRPAHLQPAERLAVARQLAALVVGDLHLHAEGRMALLHLVVELLLIGQAVELVDQRAERAERAHLGHAPGMDDVHAVFRLERLDHRARAGRAADHHTLQVRQRLAGLLEILEQREPYRRHRRAHRHLLVGEKLADGIAVELGAGHHQLGADHRAREGERPGVGVDIGTIGRMESRLEIPSASVCPANSAWITLERWE